MKKNMRLLVPVTVLILASMACQVASLPFGKTATATSSNGLMRRPSLGRHAQRADIGGCGRPYGAAPWSVWDSISSG